MKQLKQQQGGDNWQKEYQDWHYVWRHEMGEEMAYGQELIEKLGGATRWDWKVDFVLLALAKGIPVQGKAWIASLVH